MPNLIIVLGSPNTKEGELLPMAIGRLNKGYEMFLAKGSEWRVCLTGGFGDHFNTSDMPHAYYAVKYMLNKEIPFDNFTEVAQSCDTVDDAIKLKPIIEKYECEEVVLVTSDFHLDRVKYIFGKIFPKLNITYIASDYLDQCDEETKAKLLAHEAAELESLKTNGRSKLMDVALQE